MKIKKIVIILSIVLLLFVPSYNAMTIAETEAKIADMQEDMQKNIEKAEDAQYTYDQLEQELFEMSEEQKRVEEEIQATEAKMAETEDKIAEIEQELPVLIEQAEEVLQILQVTKNQNYLLDQLFSSDSSAKTAIRKTTSLNKLTEEAVEIVNVVIEKQKELEQMEIELEEQQNDLVYQQAYLEEQMALAEELQKQQQDIMAKSQTQIDEGASDIVAQQDMLDLMESAGCADNEEYGIDCGNVGSDTGFSKPMQNGYVTAEYGHSDIDYYCGYHNGIDLSSSNKSEPIYPVANGQVVSVMSPSESGGYGWYVIIQHNINGTIYFSKYAHLSSVNVSEGQAVNTDTQIGNMGNTGMSYGSHLHMSIQKGGTQPENCNTINPRDVINFPPVYVYWNGRW